MPTVSVIMPVYNGAMFLESAVESVLKQSFDDLELIVINDGSTDETEHVIQEIADPRIRYFYQENKGVSAARNAGLRIAEGKYVTFLDADDLYLDNSLGALAEYLDDHPEVEVVFSDGYLADEQGRYLMSLSEHRPDLYTGIILEPLVLTASVISGIICTMTRRGLLQQYGIEFDPALSIGEDWDFWIQVARYARFGYLDQPTCVYRIHKTNVTRTSGHRKRRQDLVLGRLKILQADWFADLSLFTRREFLFHLLVVLLQGRPLEQDRILQSEAVLSLPVKDQSYLLRMIASKYLLGMEQLSYAINCLERSLRLVPSDCKSRILLQFLRIHPAFGYVFLKTWHLGLQIKRELISIGRRQPRPVPRALSSFGDD